MQNIFIQPTPFYTNWKKNVSRYFLVGCFIAFFLIIFQPFGTAGIKMPNKNLFLSGYGVISFLVFTLTFIGLPFLLPRVFQEEKWVVWKQILLLIFTLSITLLACFFYAATWFNWNLSFYSFWGFFSTVLPMTIFPCIMIAMLDYIYLLQKHQNLAHDINPQIKTKPLENSLLSLKDENGKIDFNIPLNQFLFLQAANNYVEINYQEGEQIKKYLLRNSIRNIETQITPAFIKRCHRSYLVNMNKVGRVTGNAQGYKLHFPFTAEFVVPVSRSKGKEILAMLKG